MKEAFSRLPPPAPYLVRYTGTVADGLRVEVDGEPLLELTSSEAAALIHRLDTKNIELLSGDGPRGDQEANEAEPEFWAGSGNEPVRLALSTVLGRDISPKASAHMVAALAGEGHNQYLKGPSINALVRLRGLLGKQVIYIANGITFLTEVKSVTINASGHAQLTFRNLYAPGLPRVWPYPVPLPDELPAAEGLSVFEELIKTERCHGYMGVFEIYSNPSVIERVIATGEVNRGFRKIRSLLAEEKANPGAP